MPEMLSVPPGSLHEFLTKVSAIADGQWVAKVPVAYQDNEGETRIYQFSWQEADKKLPSAAWLVALNPVFARYCSKYGLQLGEKGHEVPITYSRQHRFSGYSYRKETFADHIRLVIKHHRRIMRQNRRAVALLAYRLNLNIEDIDRAVLYAFCYTMLANSPSTGRLLPKSGRGAGSAWFCLNLWPTPISIIKIRKYNALLGGPLMPWKVRMPSMSTQSKVFGGNPEVAACICTAIAATIPGMGLNWDAST